MSELVREAKQVIVMRKDLNMRKGKMIAQGSHASIGSLITKLKLVWQGCALELNDAEISWYFGPFKKICLYVESEAALVDIHAQALERGLTVRLVEDHGLTEFHGVLTKTCLAIGPNWADEIDPVTGHLPLL